LHNRYEVEAVIIPSAVPGNVTFKALLRPVAEQGGSYTISAQCTGCSVTDSDVIYDVTYGDVWFCFGQ
jgi:hypothetical protein